MIRPLLLLICLLAYACPVAMAQEMLPEGGMDGPFVNGLSRGWVINCYGENRATFSEEAADKHEGRSAQRVTCTSFTNGGVQFHSSGLSIEKGRTYTLKFWLKGTAPSPIFVGLRKHGEPYTRYLAREVRLTRQWRPYVISGPASGSDADCGVYIQFAGIGTLLVDSVSLVPGIHPEVEDNGLPPRKGNRVYNSGFEAGPDGWAPAGGFALDTSAAHSGRRGALIDSGALECRPFPVRAGSRYTLTAWVRATGAPVRCTLRMREWADNGGDQPSERNELSATAEVGARWTRCRVTGVPLPDLWDWYVARVETTGPVAVDDVQVEEGGETSWAPMAPVEVGAQSATRWCHPGDPVTVQATVALPPDAPPSALTYSLEDLWSRGLRTWKRNGITESDSLQFSAPAPGCYRVRVSAAGSPAYGEVWFGVFAAGSMRNPAFGTHVTDTVREPTAAMRLTEEMGIGWVRLHDFGDFCHWYRTEPEKGRWVWYDAEIEDLAKRGFHILANLGHPPLWAGAQNPRRQNNGPWTNAPPRDIHEWEEYVYQVVNHYRRWIHHWEIWNEPYWVGFFCGTPEEYAELLHAAYRAAKRADPTATVIGGPFSTVRDGWTEKVLDHGALQWMDALSYHVYWTPDAADTPAKGRQSIMEQDAAYFVKSMRDRGALKPLWMTEGGVGAPPSASWLPPEGVLGPQFASAARADRPITAISAASALVKGMVEMRAAGVQVICYYYTGGPKGAMPWFSAASNGAYVLMDFDARPKPTAMAYAVLARLLDGAVPANTIDTSGLRAYVFGQGTGSMAVAWSARSGGIRVPGAALRDLMGNPLVDARLRPGEPVYICAPRLSPGELARRLTATARAER